MIIFICTVVLVLMCAAYILIEYFNFRKALKNNVTTLSIAIASNSTGALAFDSPQDAEEILQALRADKNVVAACLYDKNGKLFAKYPFNSPVNAFPPKVGNEGLFFKDNYLEGFQPAIQRDTQVGTLYIKADTTVLFRQLKQYALIAVFLIIAALFVAYLLTSFLQKAIIKPISLLQQTAKTISESHNYSVRAVKISDDELGSLTEAFNQMLTQIEEQNSEITKAKEESSKLAAIVESSGDAIIGSSLDMIITTWNDSAERMFGYRENEIIGKPVFTLIPSGKEKEETELIERLEKGERAEPFETQMLTKNNELLDVSLTLSLVKTSDGHVNGLSRIARDISKQKQNEQRIIQSEEHLRLATTAAELGTFDLDLVNGTMLWDNRCRELFGIYHNNSVTYDKDFLNGLHKDDRERVSNIIDKAMKKEESGGHYDVEYRTVDAFKKVRWVRAKGKVFFDEESKPIRFIGAVLDITQKKNEEIKKNEFISIVSHELKTPLTSIKSYVQILLSKAKNQQDQFAANVLKRADIQTNKMTAMIHDFLNLARIEEGKMQLAKESFDLCALIKEVVNEMLLMNSGCMIEVDLCDEIPVFADKNKIYQVLLNLLSNAVKYSPPGSIITVKCEKRDKHAKIAVIDRGIGISVNDQKKLFSRFYRVDNERTKTISGFGIGLFIVSEILRSHNSKIEVESKEGEGSAFYFVLEMETSGVNKV